jgi:methionine-gamma-lyase
MSTSIHTRAVHGGRSDLTEIGVHAPPIDLSTTYPIPDLDQGTADLDAAVAGLVPHGSPVYARLHNPTVGRFEAALADLEAAEAAVAFASGMAAITACLLARLQHGSHVIAVRPVYGTTEHLLNSRLLPVEVSWVAADGVAGALRPDTSMIIIETPGNPTLDVVDIARVVRDAGGVPVLVDSTFASPVLQQPLRQGAAYVLHSATKFLGGHGDVVGGVVATSEILARPLRQVRIATGALMHPLAAYLLHRGLATLPVRIERAQASASALAQRLARHPAVARVLYPGIGSDGARRAPHPQMAGPGAVLAFELRGGHKAARAVMGALELIIPAVSLGSTDTLIQHPAGLTHRVVDAESLDQSGISEGLLRLSVGLEGLQDLWSDLDRALTVIDARTGKIAVHA